MLAYIVSKKTKLVIRVRRFVGEEHQQRREVVRAFLKKSIGFIL
jgi:hypothetical protein